MKIKWVFFVSLFMLLISVIWAYLDINSKRVSVEGCVPFNTDVESDGEEVLVTWETEEECAGYIRYGKDNEELDLVSISSDIKSKKHTATILREAKIDYYVVVVSDESVYGVDNKPILVKAN